MEADRNRTFKRLGWPSGTEPTITIVICTRLRADHLLECLTAISRMNRAPDETIVVDNSSGDEETKSLALSFGAEYLVEPLVGLSRARNRGLAAAKSCIVAYLDDDSLPDPAWIDSIRLPFTDPNVAIVTGGAFPTMEAAEAHRNASPRLLTSSSPYWFQIAAWGGLGIGANMALRKDYCAGWKLFDERLGRGAPLNEMEEFRAIIEFLCRGYSAVHLPGAVVVHPFKPRRNLLQDARNSMAYWIMLYSEFPAHRGELLRFLIRRLRRKPLEWHRDSRDAGEIISSSPLSLARAGIAGVLLYIRYHKKVNG